MSQDAPPESRVERALADNGGRIKQSALAEELGWSAARTSMIASSMAEAGRVEKLRIGREVLLSLPETDGEDGASQSDASAGTHGNDDTDGSDDADDSDDADGGSSATRVYGVDEGDTRVYRSDDRTDDDR